MNKLALYFACGLSIITTLNATTERSFTFKNPNGDVIIKLLLDQKITEQRNVDALVNAANEQLIGSAGVARALQDAAGSETFISYIEKNIPLDKDGIRCKIGHAVVTPAFQLTETMGNKHIIHTVGPRGGTEWCEADLVRCYRNCLNVAQKLKLSSLAFPTISTGIFGFDKKLAARLVTHLFAEFASSKENKTTIKEIRLLVWGKEYYELYEQLLAKFETTPPDVSIGFIIRVCLSPLF